MDSLRFKAAGEALPPAPCCRSSGRRRAGLPAASPSWSAGPPRTPPTAWTRARSRPRGAHRGGRSPPRRGDQAVATAVAEVGRWLGHGGAILVNLFNPRVIVLGGYFAELADHLIPSAQANLARHGGRQHRRPLPLRRVAPGLHRAARGGAGVVVERMIEDPTGFPPPRVPAAGGGMSGPHGAAPTGPRRRDRRRRSGSAIPPPHQPGVGDVGEHRLRRALGVVFGDAFGDAPVPAVGRLPQRTFGPAHVPVDVGHLLLQRRTRHGRSGFRTPA